jgi:hypothetical protein
MTPVKDLRDIGRKPVLSAPVHVSRCRVREVNRSFDPVDLHVIDPERYPHLLQSTAHWRFDILFAFPHATNRLVATGALHGPAGRC